ncbi:MAG: tRNA pseudouridine(13) synthase TruD [Candidatus Aenigmarchaeota archaeon]|nr:tRNA pseudouridine(13) synthase TruD [Candidatus Aenigmarchaeota archaeon]
MLSYLHWTKSRGIRGKILTPEDFVVKEIIDKKFLRKFSRSGNGVSKQSGFFLYLLKKENITTPQAIKLLSRRFGINEKEIGYAGLKDKFAVTEQYITMKRDVDDFMGSLSLSKIKTTDKFMSKGDLIGNEFVITLHNAKFNENIIKEIKATPIPNYFGRQRFGKYGNNHVIGKYLIKRDFDKALNIINKNSGKTCTSINHVKKDELKFYIHSYQSCLFNEVLNTAIKNKVKVDKIKLIGSDTKLGNNASDKILSQIIKKEKIKQNDFSIRDLSLSCLGTERKAFISVTDIDYHVSSNAVKLSFSLPKGSYATVLINEICK